MREYRTHIKALGLSLLSLNVIRWHQRGDTVKLTLYIFLGLDSDKQHSKRAAAANKTPFRADGMRSRCEPFMRSWTAWSRHETGLHMSVKEF
jgi:hypothetical protein